MVSFIRVNSVRLLAMNTALSIPDNGQNSANRTNAKMNIPFSLTNPVAGDHTSTPARNIAATIKATSPQMIKLELIISRGFLAFGKKRMMAVSRPKPLIKDNMLIVDIIAADTPTSYAV